MKIKTLFSLTLVTALLLPATGLHAKKAVFEETVELKGEPMVKVGEGTFRWMFFRVYDGVLYLDADRPDADPLSDVAKCLELVYSVGISAEDFRESGNSILRRNVDESTWNQLQDRLAKLNAAYQSVEEGDRYGLIYVPGKGTTLARNGEFLVTVPGPDFARAYFSIWLGEDAVKESFREDLLGN